MTSAGGSPRGVAADRRRTSRDPPGGRVRVLGRRGERMLGREAVIDRGDQAAGAIRQEPADSVVRLEVADHPATAVEEDEDGERPPPFGYVEAQRDVAGRPRADAILDLGNR